VTTSAPGADPLVRDLPAWRGSSTLWRAASLWRTRIGLVVVAALALVAVVGPYLAPHGTTEFVGPPFSGPSAETLLGTDLIGRDVLSRVLGGGRTLLVMAVLATAFGVGAGAVWGVGAAYSRNWLDGALMRGADVLLAFPQVVLVLLAVSTVGPQLWLIVFTVGLSHLPRTARVMRGAAVEVVERDFVKASEIAGERRWRLLLKEILPNITGPLLVEAGLRLTYSVAIIAAVGFLGFGLQPPAADWGLMINENRVGLTLQPWAVVAPVVAIGLLTIGMNLVTDGVARASSRLERRP
jgi:peptide/nickel transport system permease protein